MQNWRNRRPQTFGNSEENNPYSSNISKRDENSSQNYSFVGQKVNLQLNNEGIFDKNIEVENNELRRETPQKIIEERTSIELAQDPNILQNISSHNEYLMNLDVDLENLVIVNLKKTKKGIKEMAKTKGSFFESEPSTNHYSNTIPNNEDIQYSEGKHFISKIFYL